ncbi:MAG: hypothetical protein ACREAK_05920 [Nitrosarchaeum sp.]
MTERMRKRIEVTYGPTMDKAADAVFEAIGKMWGSMLNLRQKKKSHQSCKKFSLMQIGSNSFFSFFTL